MDFLAFHRPTLRMELCRLVGQEGEQKAVGGARSKKLSTGIKQHRRTSEVVRTLIVTLKKSAGTQSIKTLNPETGTSLKLRLSTEKST